MRLARAGAAVVIGNRSRDQGQAVVAEIRDLGGKADFVRTDVSNCGDIQALAHHAVAHYGRIDVAFNNSGIDGEQKPLHEQELVLADQVIDINLKGMFWSMKYEIEAMLKNPVNANREGRGAIVNNSSVFGLRGFPNWALYVASKHAVTGMTEKLPQIAD